MSDLAGINPTGTVTFTDTTASPNATLGSGLISGGVLGLNFVNSSEPSIGTSEVAAVVGDFNRDGKADIAVCEYGSGVGILLGQGDGTFQAEQIYPSGNTCWGLVLGDFNRDGKLDLISFDGGGTISVLLGNGDGTFGAGTTYPVAPGAYGGVVGDFNNDGKLDIVTAAAASSEPVQLLLGNGDGSFQPPVNLGTFAQSFSVTAGDFNNDGRLDLAVSEYDSNDVQILLGTVMENLAFQFHMRLATADASCRCRPESRRQTRLGGRRRKPDCSLCAPWKWRRNSLASSNT